MRKKGSEKGGRVGRVSPCLLSMHEQMIIILQDRAFDIHIWDLDIPYETLWYSKDYDTDIQGCNELCL